MEMHRDKRGDSLSEAIIECIIEVHRTLGPGFLESIYQNALEIELQRRHLKTEREKELIIRYRDETVGRHRLDLVVEDSVIIELKTVDDLSKAHYAQARSYLAASDILLGILVNFSAFKADFRRVTLQ